ncbi:hypothetical protein AGABI2DRAFT_115808 [Agaricus bisporus var. bisporus H97]|uniref:hypothetical protein n=1 Tax=Agaricus bisporus var. bisporus (strain H97 / ATCC MYA-4626 / FGSC 10389) TaxID=936046 RepID=UPI00029F5D00|nr:hypothetical protein AGABI2DRAFT_115808 [Agaricus bisporus var. bisporus H97]EKV50753.1 hypothetical protein AGABI2DRAFT_115808 [Agaricus bisporus var. bisporus H97]
MSSLPQVSGFSFSLFTPSSIRFGPRLGEAILKRAEQTEIRIQTPHFLTTTSRGVIPHLSRDHYGSSGIHWVNVPFESFLAVPPPVPTLVHGRTPLHTFLGFSPGQHIVSMSLRDPENGREMPANGNNHVSAYSLQGVRKVAPRDWKSYVYSCKPDIVFALSDTPYTEPPYSQKRLTKSNDRSASWLANIIASGPAAADVDISYKPSIFVHMAGSTSIPARKAFAEGLLEKLFGPEAETIKPLQTLDQGVSGYSFDLVPLRLSLGAQPQYSPAPTSTLKATVSPSLSISDSQNELEPALPFHMDQLPPLLQVSLEALPTTKLRLVNTINSPHEILRLISTVGIDIFDARWAQRAGDIGVSLDFTFPAPSSPSTNRLKSRSNGKIDIGHNLYDDSYTHDYSSFSSEHCECSACSPVAPSTRIYHGADDPSYTYEQEPSPLQKRIKASFTRAYIHHLLHTHEMSSHSLLVMHNLSILESFFSSIRLVLLKGDNGEWEREVKRFMDVYDERLEVFDEARDMWREVDLARGKGRLAREKAKFQEENGEVVEGVVAS